MPKLVALEPLFVPKDARDAAVAVLDALARVRLVPFLSLRAYASAEGLDPEILETWVGTGLMARTSIITDAVRGTTLDIAALTPAGARALDEPTQGSARAVPPARLKRSGHKLAHDAGVGDVALAFLAAHRAKVVHCLGVVTDDSLLATSVVMQGVRGATRVPLKADAYVMLEGPRGSAGLLIEFDRATTGPKKLSAKFAAYAAWRAAGGPHRSFSTKAIRILTIVPDTRRLERLHAAALDATGGKHSGFFLFAEARHFTAADPSALTKPIVRRLGDDGFVPLVDASPSRGVARQGNHAAA
jgi:hypothetical protein